MSRSTTKPLPANLPKPPPVPAGYDAWEPKGWGYLGGVGDYAYANESFDRWLHGRAGCCGDKGFFYLLAVKRPAKASAAKKTKKPERKAGRVVAVRMYRAPSGVVYGSHAEAKAGGDWEPSHLYPIDCLPADAASVERMVEQVNRAVRPDLFSDDPVEAHRAASPYTVESRRAEIDRYTRIALAAIGIGIAATGKGGSK